MVFTFTFIFIYVQNEAFNLYTIPFMTSASIGSYYYQMNKKVLLWNAIISEKEIAIEMENKSEFVIKRKVCRNMMKLFFFIVKNKLN